MGKRGTQIRAKGGKRRNSATAAANAKTKQPKATAPIDNATKNKETSANQQRPSKRNNSKGKRNRYRLDLGEACLNREEERARAFVPVLNGQNISLANMDIHAVRPKGFALVPRRPTWSYEDDKEALEKREEQMFAKWMKEIDSDCLYERNLETWRQLWRVVERSDVLVLVVDIRFPALHFVPDLFTLVKETPGKEMLIALNKCDLVSNDVREAWCAYFKREFPQLQVVSFSSFPDAKLVPCEANSEILSKRERRMARSKLAAWGSDQLVDAVYELPLSVEKKRYLAEWRDAVHRESKAVDNPNLLDCDNFDRFCSMRSFSPMSDDVLDNRDLTETNKERRSRGKKGRKRPRGKSGGKPDLAAIAAAAAESKKEVEEVEGISGGHSDVPAETSDVPGSMVSHDDDDRMMDDMITIGIVGHPNTGKSSLINGIFKKKVVSTSRTPGHTKIFQTMFLTPRVRLCDCPGLVFPAHAPRELQTLAGMFPISQVKEPYAVVKYLADRLHLPKILGVDNERSKAELREEKCIDSEEPWTAYSICEAWALKRGFRNAKSSRLDVYRAANSILRMSLEGRIVLHTVPPGFVQGSQSNMLDGLSSAAPAVNLLEVGKMNGANRMYVSEGEEEKADGWASESNSEADGLEEALAVKNSNVMGSGSSSARNRFESFAALVDENEN